MNFGKIFLSFAVISSILFNSIPLAAQVKSSDEPFDVRLSYTPADNAETFRRMISGARETAFSQTLAAMLGDADAKDVENALEAQAVYFFENFQAEAAKSLAKMPAKSKEISNRRYEELKLKKTADTPVKTRRAANENLAENPFLNASFNGAENNNFKQPRFTDANYRLNPAADEPQVETVETDTTIQVTGTQTKTIETEQGTVTRSSKADDKATFDGKVRTLETSQEETVESVSKTTAAKLTKVAKIGFGASFEACPDGEGLVRGKGKSNIYRQTTINTGKQLAALTTDYTLEFQITAHVNDEAVMTHFDMEGVLTEKVLGYDRALRLDLIKSANGMQDGAKSIVYQITGSTPPSETTDQYGFKQNISPTLGNVSSKLFGINNSDEAQRLAEVGRAGLGGIMIYLEMLMRSSISGWTNGECVEVECTAAKKTLKPNEAIDVTAVSVSRQDLGIFSANLHGSGTETVTPEDQKGTPKAVYNLTAPSKDKATIVVKTVSKRGIGLGVLEIPVEEAKKKPPVITPPKEAKKDCTWSGTVKAVRTQRVDKTEKADGRLVRAVTTKQETYSVDIMILGDRDLSQGIVNDYYGNSEASFLGTEYRERNYAPGKMSCGGTMLTSPETQKYEDQTKGTAKEKIIVTISVIGDKGFIMFSAPTVSAERIIMRTYETACPAYNQVNTSTDRSSPLIEIIRTGFEVEFDVDPGTPNVIKGSKTVQNSDGSETKYSWDLSRCK